MKMRDAGVTDPVAGATVDALMAAQWQCADLLSRKSSTLAGELLRGHAAELASSPIARDQILSKALDAAAADLEADRAPLRDGAAFFFRDPPPCATAKLVVREQVFRHHGVPGRASDDVAAELERRHRPDCRADHELSARLADEARLHELLWDDPRLPGEDHTRLIMLCAVPKMLERAQALDPNHARAIWLQDAPRRRHERALTLVSKRWLIARPRQVPSSPSQWRMVGWLTALGLVVSGVTGWILIGP